MVEMLGVLAIIGVLSVAGIKGYTIAMRKYYANEIAQAIAMMGAAMKTANGGAGVEPNTDYTDLLKESSVPSGVNSLKATDDTTIVLKANDENLCEAVAQLFGDDTSNSLYWSADDCEDGDHKLTLKVKYR